MKTKYLNPYFAGFLLGLVLLGCIYITGRGLGSSGAFKSAVVGTVGVVAHEHTDNTHYYQEYYAEHEGNPLKSWLVFEVAGALLGAFVSGLLAKRLTWKLERPKTVKARTRIIGATLGGLFFAFGAQFGRGCTSGAALSGMAVLSTGGIITMGAIFGGAYAFAFFFRKLWLNKGE